MCPHTNIVLHLDMTIAELIGPKEWKMYTCFGPFIGIISFQFCRQGKSLMCMTGTRWDWDLVGRIRSELYTENKYAEKTS